MADTLGYNDLMDLIQNQRALAELVAKIKMDYNDVMDDMDFARNLDTRIKNLNTSMQTVLDDFDNRIAQSDEDMKAALQEVKTNAENLKTQAQEMVDTLTVNGTTSFALLTSTMMELFNIVKGTGEYIDNDANKENGMIDILHRVESLEARTPTIQIAPDGEVIPVIDRLEGVLYGKITQELRDIGKYAALKLSPSLQGVIQ